MQIFPMAKTENRRNTVCISRISGKAIRKICQKDSGQKIVNRLLAIGAPSDEYDLESERISDLY